MNTGVNRFGLAVLLSPLSVPAIFSILSVAHSGFNADAIRPWEVLAVVTVVSYIGLFGIGIPAFVILGRINKIRLWSLCIAGAFGAIVVGLIIRIVFEGGYSKPFSLVDDIGPLVLFSGLGVVVAATFGLIARVPMK